jgi:U32 family peptidase
MDQEKNLVGKVTHFFSKIGVAVIELSDELSVGDEISIEGPMTHVTQKIDSMQIENKDIEKAGAGEAVGMKVNDKVRERDSVYKIA